MTEALNLSDKEFNKAIRKVLHKQLQMHLK